MTFTAAAAASSTGAKATAWDGQALNMKLSGMNWKERFAKHTFTTLEITNEGICKKRKALTLTSRECLMSKVEEVTVGT